MENPKCLICNEELILGDFERFCVGEDGEKRACWGICPKCDTNYSWEERLERVEISNLEKE